MKKLSVIMFFLSLIMIGCTENRVLYSELKESGGLMYFQGKPFTGIAFRMHNESQVKEETPYKDGVEEGIYKNYSSDGQLLEEMPYKGGKRNGMFKTYYPEGLPSQEGAYKDDRRVGVWIKYTIKDGKSAVYSQQTYKDGRPAGEPIRMEY